MATKLKPAPVPWRNRIVGTGDVAPDQLVANPANWRTHPGPQRDALRGSLSEVGWVQQVMVNRRTGFVVDGHARVEEALTRHEPTVPVLYVDLSPEEEALVLATLDPIGAMATRDDAKLAELLDGLVVDDAVMSRTHYNYQHEPCWYGVKAGCTAGWQGDTKQTTVWEATSPKMMMGGGKEEKFDHPTQKPIAVISRPLLNHRGDVYEPFSGSGTTIIAAEQLGRRCYAMEIDPRYVQVAIERWQAFTGQTAEKL